MKAGNLQKRITGSFYLWFNIFSVF